MKVALDTNVLVRFLTLDDAEQARLATEIIDSAETIFVSTIVLCELAWVLQCAYRVSAQDIADQIARIIESRNVETDRVAAERGLQHLRQGGDFADGVILAEARRNTGVRVVTLDCRFASLARDAEVALLGAGPA